MKKYFLMVMVLVSIVTITQAQKNKKQINKAESSEDIKDWKPKKGDIRNPFDTNKVKQVKANGLGVGDDPFGKNEKLKGELTTYKKSNTRSRKGVVNSKAPGGINHDSLKTKPGKANGLGEGEDPFDKQGTRTQKMAVKADGLSVGDDPFGKKAKLTAGDDPFGKSGAKRKKPAVKNNGYANQEISYAKPAGVTTPSSQNNITRKPVKGKKQLTPVTPNNQ